MFEKLLPYDVAHIILSAYFNYYHQFKRITKRAQIRFEMRDWIGMHEDSKERITHYRDIVGETTEKIFKLLGDKMDDRNIWAESKGHFSYDTKNFNTRNIAETFFNSVFRHSHKGMSADEYLMYVQATATYREFKSTDPIFINIILANPLSNAIRTIFTHYVFDAPWEDIERDIRYISEYLSSSLKEMNIDPRNSRLELLKSVFYRSKGAYIVGRLIDRTEVHPFVLPLLHQQQGISVDALLLRANEVTSMFSYSRSYFLVDVDIVSETVDFLRSILPHKSFGEFYNSIGFEKHGKTVFYRDFLRHLIRSKEKFIVAPGIKGMVMSVFTLPSYTMVFKVIKDQFAPPKHTTTEEVKRKYEIVNLHDRVGRMTDSHMFENLTFEKWRFSPELLEELCRDSPMKIKLRSESVEIKHLYVEKKMTPLNIFLENASLQESYEVINEYGLAIKELAAVNIFPGDMLLKNFGVTRLKRVVFYDYDEIIFLTDCNFRVMPEPQDDYEIMSAEPFYHVGPNDIFPEEFPRFLIGNPRIREMFFELHGDLYQVAFWKDMQNRLRNGDIIDVFPYHEKLRFCKYFQKVSQVVDLLK